jgi:hypothetical protein
VWQHHARLHGGNLLSIFGNGASPAKEAQSGALLLALDTAAMRATLTRAYTHPAGLLAANQGSAQLLADGRMLVGWGNLPYLSLFLSDGTLIMDGQFPVGDQSYRAFTADWTGRPADKPAVVAEANPAGGSVIYASWNGATELASWTVLAGSSPGGLGKAGSQRRPGVETAISVNTTGLYFAVTGERRQRARPGPVGHLARSSRLRPSARPCPPRKWFPQFLHRDGIRPARPPGSLVGLQ